MNYPDLVAVNYSSKQGVLNDDTLVEVFLYDADGDPIEPGEATIAFIVAGPCPPDGGWLLVPATVVADWGKVN